jgi:fructose-1,6-bisphosphatase/inositol monophosphatase family enzyme
VGLMCGIGRCALCVCVALVQWTCVDWLVGGLISFMSLALEVPAGALILEEAGGHVFDPSGSEFDMMSHRVAASSKHLKQALVEGLEGFV